MYSNMCALFWITVYFGFHLSATVQCQSIGEAKQLHTDLLKDYNKFVRPVENQTKSIDVYLSFAVIAIQDFDEVREKFSVTGVFLLYWVDETINWKDEDYGNITSVFIGYKDVWVPEIILTNPSQKLDSFGKEWQLIRYDSSGAAFWYPADLIKATCSLDVRYFPFDVQECSMEIYVWGYNVFEANFKLTQNNIDTSFLRGEHGTWKLLNASIKVETVNFVSRATLIFILERKSQYVIVNIVLPILFLCILNVLVFILPAESGERVSYAITVLLAIAVFMTIISDTLPKKSEPLPLISYFLMIDLIVSALTSLFTILNLQIFYKKDNQPIPKWLLKMYQLLTCTCRQREGQDAVMYNGNGELLDTAHVGTDNSKRFSKRRVFDADPSIAVAHYQTPVRRFNSRTSTSEEEISGVSWRDISKMFDYILLAFFALVTILSFIIFLIITQVK